MLDLKPSGITGIFAAITSLKTQPCHLLAPPQPLLESHIHMWALLNNTHSYYVATVYMYILARELTHNASVSQIPTTVFTLAVHVLRSPNASVATSGHEPVLTCPQGVLVLK